MVGLFVVPLQIRRLSINRSRYAVTETVGGGTLCLSCLLVGLGWMPMGWWYGLMVLQVLGMLACAKQRPMQMDYSLFLRAAEGLLKAAEPAIPELHRRGALGKTELPASDVFLKPRMGIIVPQVRWGFVGGCVAFAAGLILLLWLLTRSL